MAARGNWGRNAPSYYTGGYPNAAGGQIMPQMNYYMNNVSQDRRYQGGYAQQSKRGGYGHDDRRRDHDRKRPRSQDRRREESKGGPNRSNNGPKYDVRVPKYCFAQSKLSSVELRQRLNRISTPGDFCQVNLNWTTSFPAHKPMNLSMDCDMHIFHKEVEVPNPQVDDSSPVEDANFSHSVRVMLLGTPSLGEIIKQSCRMADESGSTAVDKTNPSKLFSFLVALQGKSDHLMLGGAWSPSRDGSDPSQNPKTLVNTAIRCAKSHLGVDLSSCTEWIRFMEIHYNRLAGTKVVDGDLERTIEQDCVETVTFMIPIISHLQPSEEQWEQLKTQYAAALERACSGNKDKPQDQQSQQQQQPQEPDSSMDESMTAQQSEPTHWSKLDVNTMKVNELKAELVARGQDPKGLKNNLITRLQTCIDEEKTKESETAGQPAASSPSAEVAVEQAVEAAASAEETGVVESGATNQEVSEKEKRRLERLYRLPERPCLLIHPRSSVEFYRVSLCSLLDHRPESGEHGFELSLFAQQFNEMLQRDAAFHILAGLHVAKDSSSSNTVTAENGETNSSEEPEQKKQHVDESATANTTRKYRRTADPRLLFSFVFFDSSQGEYIRESDLMDILVALGLGYSKNQLRKLVGRIRRSGKEDLYYRSITDVDVVQGSAEDVVTIEGPTTQDLEIYASGNAALQGKSVPEAARLVIGGTGASSDVMRRLELAESCKKDVQFRFHKLKEELENTRLKLNGYQDVEDKLKKELHDLQSKHRTEVKQCQEQRQMASAYSRLLREQKSVMDRCVSDINRQMDKYEPKPAEKEKGGADTADSQPKKQDDIVLDTA